jgi:hypothetical protein
MSGDIRRLSDELRRSLTKGKGADLTAEDVDIALAALRSAAGIAGPHNLAHFYDLFQIEMLDDHGWPTEVLASVVHGRIAHAAFTAAADRHTERRIRLRRGPEILADTETKQPSA